MPAVAPHTQDSRVKVIAEMLLDQSAAGMFNMKYWKKKLHGEPVIILGHRSNPVHCGTIACIGGTCELAFPHLTERGVRQGNVSTILGIPYEVACALCYPPEYYPGGTPLDSWGWITVEHAVLALIYSVELSRTDKPEHEQEAMMIGYWKHLYEQHQGCPPSL